MLTSKGCGFCKRGLHFFEEVASSLSSVQTVSVPPPTPPPVPSNKLTPQFFKIDAELNDLEVCPSPLPLCSDPPPPSGRVSCPIVPHVFGRAAGLFVRPLPRRTSVLAVCFVYSKACFVRTPHPLLAVSCFCPSLSGDGAGISSSSWTRPSFCRMTRSCGFNRRRSRCSFSSFGQCRSRLGQLWRRRKGLV
jgi:hypothetical protein